MNGKRLPIIRYERKSERLTLREWWAKAPVRFTLLGCIFLNWFVCGFISLRIGGFAIGITPSTQGFVVKDHGHFTTVSKPIWLFSLFYPAATLLFTHLATLFLGLSLIRGLFRRRSPYLPFMLFTSPFFVPLAYSIIGDCCRSLLDYWHMNTLWPAVSWLLLVVAIAFVLILIVVEWQWSRRERLRLLSAINAETLAAMSPKRP
jgi:hypothetical protein